MQRSVKASTQEDEISNIDAHLEYVKKALRWSINDLERFISLLKARVASEELYVKSLSQISRLSSVPEPEACPYFGQEKSTYELATFQYELSLDKIISSRRDFILAMKSQIDILIHVKDKQEQRRKTVKQHVADKNMDYTTYRTREFVKAKKMYFGKCNELAAAQQQFHEGSAYEAADHGLSPVIADEPRKSTEIDNDTDGSSISSIPDSTHNATAGNRKKMGGFMAQMRTQLAAATATAADPSKQNARFAKIKKDIHDTDHEYRQGVRYLEHLRKTQIETMNHAMKHVEVVFLDKAEATRSVLTSILNNEHAALLREASLAQGNKTRVDAIDPQLDVSLFRAEYQKKHFTEPEQIYYENYYNGIYKDVLFGSSLDEYAMEHQRTVPLVVSKCIDAVEQMGGLQKEGIYRISGRQTNVDMLKAEFEKNEETFQPQSHYDVFTIASVLKIFLRELMVPLFSFSVPDRVKYSTVQNQQQRLSFLQHKVAELSQPRRDTLEAVVRHLDRVNTHSDVNKMNIQNLSYMFTPAIFHDHNQAEHPGEWRSDLVFEDLILHHDTVFAPIGRQQPISSPPTPLAHGHSSDFKDSLPVQDASPAPAVPLKSTAHTNNSNDANEKPASRSRSSTLSHVSQQQPPPPPSSMLPSILTLANTQQQPPSSPPLSTAKSSNVADSSAASSPQMIKGQSVILPSSSALGTTTSVAADDRNPVKKGSPPAVSAEEQMVPEEGVIPSSASTSLSMSATPTSSTEMPKSQGLLRRATLKARAAIPPRQQSLRLKNGRQSAGSAAISTTVEPVALTAQSAISSASTPAATPVPGSETSVSPQPNSDNLTLYTSIPAESPIMPLPSSSASPASVASCPLLVTSPPADKTGATP